MLKTGVLTAIGLMLVIGSGAPAIATLESLEIADCSGILRPPISVGDEKKGQEDEDALESARADSQGSMLFEKRSAQTTSTMEQEEDAAVSENKTEKPSSGKKQMPGLKDDGAPVTSRGGDKPSFGGGSDANLATKVAGFLFGTIFGTPVAMVRSAGVDLKRGTGELTGQSKNPVLVGLVGTVLLPYTAASGLVQGPFYGVENAYKREPFTKDSFSLGGDFQ